MDPSKEEFEAGSSSAQLDDAYGGVDVMVRLLKRKLDVLTSMASDKRNELDHAESIIHRRKVKVNIWLEQVEWIRADVQQLDVQVAEASRVDKRMREVEQLIEQGESSTGLTLDEEKTESIEVPTHDLVGRNFKLNKGKILECLRKDNIFIVGIHGMGGVGKTTLATHIYNQLLKDRETTVHWIAVSGECSISKLQRDLAFCLSVDLSKIKDDEKKTAARLSRTLKGKKDVIILDNLRKNYPLEKVGIPDGCKLILTSRSLDLCRQMGCHELINVKSLPEEEAWQLFKKNLARRVPFTHKVEGIARSVVNECCGFPLDIIVLSGSMRGVEDIFEWRYVLEELRESRSIECMEDEVFRVLRFSYDRLSDATARQCFMHLALFPADHEIQRSELVQHFIDAGLLSGRSSMEAALNRGHAVINKLLGVNLFECSKQFGKDFVKMHDVVRDMVISMTKARFLVLPKLGIRDTPLEDWTEGLEKISLMDNNIDEIPSGASPRCPKLSVLLLNGNPLRSIPDEFFEHMPSLQLLDLSGTWIETLPSSIMGLDKLTVLYLSGCRDLHDIPPLEKLVSLDLEGSNLETWPTLSQFCHLRFLSLLWSTAQMKGSELRRLEKLEMLKCNFYEARELNACVEYMNDKPRRWCYEMHLTGEPGEPG